MNRKVTACIPGGARPATALLLLLLFIGCSPSSDQDTANPAITFWALPPHEALQPSPRSVHLGHDGILYVLDTLGRIVLMDPSDGTVKDVRWMPEYSVGRPEGLCLLRDGRLAVADTHYHRVVLFHPNGTVQQMFGSNGTDAGQFIYPVAIDEDGKGNLFVAEYGSNDRVQKFTPDGVHLLTFSSFGSNADQLQRPAGLRCHDGKVYIADALNHRIQVFEQDGTHIQSLPTQNPSLFYLPYDLAIDDHGGITVVEYGNGRVTRVTPNGEHDESFSHSGYGARLFRTPWGGDIRGKVLVVADTGNRRIVRMELP